MATRKINTEYLKLIKELVLLGIISFARKKNHPAKKGRILIVIPCLIGEFVTAIPALYDFIRAHKETRVDLLVTPVVKPLAEKINGAGTIFTGESVYARREETSSLVQHFGEYEKIIVLRTGASTKRLIKRIKSSRIQVAFSHMLRFSLHLAKNLVAGQRPKGWRVVNFEMLGRKERNISPEEIFTLPKKTKAGRQKKTVIIHTGNNWPMKHWPKEKWVELLQKIDASGDFHFIFVGGREDVDDYEYITPRLGFEVESLIGAVDLFELYLAMRVADYFIGIDSGPANLAHLADLRSLTIFGPGPHIYMPTNPLDIIIDKSRGRGVLQMFISVKNNFMRRITPSEVFDAFEKLVKSTLQ